MIGTASFVIGRCTKPPRGRIREWINSPYRAGRQTGQIRALARTVIRAVECGREAGAPTPERPGGTGAPCQGAEPAARGELVHPNPLTRWGHALNRRARGAGGSRGGPYGPRNATTRARRCDVHAGVAGLAVCGSGNTGTLSHVGTSLEGRRRAAVGVASFCRHRPRRTAHVVRQVFPHLVRGAVRFGLVVVGAELVTGMAQPPGQHPTVTTRHLHRPLPECRACRMSRSIGHVTKASGCLTDVSNK